MRRYLSLLLISFFSIYMNGQSQCFTGGDGLESVAASQIEYHKGKIDFSVLNLTTFEEAKSFDFGQSNEPIWVRLNILNKAENEDIFVVLPIAHIDSIRMYDSIDFGNFSFTVSGDLVKNSAKEFKDPYQIFRVKIKEGTAQSIYFRVSSSSQIILPFSLATETAIEEHINSRNILFGAFVGVLLVMFFYNLIVYLYTKADSYTYYIFYLVAILTAQVGLTGLSNYFFGEHPVLNNSLLFIGSGFAGVFSILFIQSFLKVKQKLPKLYIGLNFLIALYITVVISAFLGVYTLSFKLINIGGALIALSFAIVSITLAIRGDRKAKFYLTAWIGLIISVIIFTMVLSGFIDFVPNTNFIIPIGVVLETVLLSLALADSINILRKESEEANERIVKEVTKNEELIKNQNLLLERRVSERTAELQLALDNLKSAQSQLVQSEKMASLGTLTAGIAHEINNPINFVSANVIPLRENIDDIANLITEYRNIDFKNLKAELKRLTKLEEEIELEYMLNETKQLVDGIEEGADRTHAIVEGLTTFSRGDAGQKRKANIMKGIKSTLSVLKSRLNAINLIVDYDEDVPLVTCQVGKINQVVLNLANNALDALEEKNGANSPSSTLMIATKKVGDSVQISIKDNANGMNEEIQSKIMEPFYTTKDVGKGTGLGLSISYSIIEDHGGTLDLESKEGVGTTFTVTLPIVDAQG